MTERAGSGARAGCETTTPSKRLRFYDYANYFIAFFLSTRARARQKSEQRDEGEGEEETQEQSKVLVEALSI